MWRPLLLSLALAGLSAAAAPSDINAHGETAVDRGEPRVSASLVVDAAEAAPGSTVRAGVHFTLDEGWHIYWRNPGEAGLPSQVALTVEGAEVGPLQEPAPHTFRDGGGLITTYGHSGEVLLFRTVTLPADATGTRELVAKVDVLACKETCIPGRLTLKRPLPVGKATLPSAEAPLFERTQAAVPRASKALGLTWKASLESAPQGAPEAGQLVRGQPVRARLEATCEGAGCAGLKLVEKDAFVPDAVEGLDTVFTSQTVGPLALALAGKALPDGAAGVIPLKGVVQAVGADGKPVAVEVEAPLGTFSALAPQAADAEPAAVPGAPQAAAPEGATGTPGVAFMLLLAFLGGALLNLMPCVFPVLALKVFSFLKLVGGTRKKAAAHALAYTVGIEVALLALAVVVLAVRAAGTQVGWGFQFQEPLFVAAVCAVVVAFALNLFGVFTIGGDAAGLAAGVDRTHGVVRSAGEGVLAVVLATPCSAPFLGSAVGFALAESAPVVLGIFAALGLGLAMPFVVLVLVPQGAKWLPRPGAWMDWGKQLLGFALLATAAWLAWVLGQLAGIDAVGRLLAFLVAVALGSWLWGLGQQSGRRVVHLVALGVVAAAAAVTLRFSPVAEARAASLKEGWQPYSEQVLAEALQAGRPVFVDFTADWCLTCKFNERTVLASSGVQEAFARANAVLLVVDFTRKDAAIAQMLAKHGRAGVPLYLVYRPESPASPAVLPELLTEDVVREALRGKWPAG